MTNNIKPYIFWHLISFLTKMETAYACTPLCTRRTPPLPKLGGEHIIRPIIGLCCGQFLSCHHQPRKPAGIIAHCSETAENLQKIKSYKMKIMELHLHHQKLKLNTWKYFILKLRFSDKANFSFKSPIWFWHLLIEIYSAMSKPSGRFFQIL